MEKSGLKTSLEVNRGFTCHVSPGYIRKKNKTIIRQTSKIVQLAKKLDNSKLYQARVKISKSRKTFAEIARLNSLKKNSQLI
jgi:hypothetical protein